MPGTSSSRHDIQCAQNTQHSKKHDFEGCAPLELAGLVDGSCSIGKVDLQETSHMTSQFHNPNESAYNL